MSNKNKKTDLNRSLSSKLNDILPQAKDISTNFKISLDTNVEKTDFSLGTEENQERWFEGLFDEFVEIPETVSTKPRHFSPLPKQYTFSKHASRKLLERSVATERDIIKMHEQDFYWPLFQERGSYREHHLMYFEPSDSFLVAIIDVKYKMFVSIWYPDYGHYGIHNVDQEAFDNLKAKIKRINKQQEIKTSQQNLDKKYVYSLIFDVRVPGITNGKFFVVKKFKRDGSIDLTQTMKYPDVITFVSESIKKGGLLGKLKTVLEDGVSSVLIHETYDDIMTQKYVFTSADIRHIIELCEK